MTAQAAVEAASLSDLGWHGWIARESPLTQVSSTGAPSRTSTTESELSEPLGLKFLESGALLALLGSL